MNLWGDTADIKVENAVNSLLRVTIKREDECKLSIQNNSSKVLLQTKEIDYFSVLKCRIL